ncbi:polysaccharide export protein [candidate division WOR-3 bacterium]|nr:polysaccharide export protein [candidate division WOR-3 bacterium]
MNSLILIVLCSVSQVFAKGDQLKVILVAESAESRENLYTIQSDGTIILPVVGRIMVEGLTIEQAQNEISRYLRDIYRDPTVYVIPVWNITILGEVKSPGVYDVEGSITASRLLSLSGGPAQRADLVRAALYRDGNEIHLNLKECLAMSGTEKDVELKSGDVIYVPKVWWPSWTEWGTIMTTMTFMITLYKLSQ